MGLFLHLGVESSVWSQNRGGEKGHEDRTRINGMCTTHINTQDILYVCLFTVNNNS